MARSIQTCLLLWHSSWLPYLQHLLCNMVEVVVRMTVPLHLSLMIPLLCLPLLLFVLLLFGCNKGVLFVYSL